MGQVYYDMGFLSSAEVIECSASELVGQYVGQTGPKTKKLFEKALGRVLFIDEAYRLGEGPFAKEAMDELVGILTQPNFLSKIVVILAGYDQEMNQLLAVNTGLSSRFPDEVIFRHMRPADCLELLKRELKKNNITLEDFDDETSETFDNFINQLSELPSWGNARDIKTLAKEMAKGVLLKVADGDPDDKLTLDASDALTDVLRMLMTRQERTGNKPNNTASTSQGLPVQTLNPGPALAPPPTSIASPTIKTRAPPKKIMETAKQGDIKRDAGVTDAVWRQLQADKQAVENTAKGLQEEIRVAQQNAKEAAKREKAEKALAKQLTEKQAKDAAEQNELKRKQEEARLRECEARAERERIAAVLAARQREQAEQKHKEDRAQAKLREMGVCAQGFRWVKQANGYRCAGGMHFVSDRELGI